MFLSGKVKLFRALLLLSYFTKGSSKKVISLPFTNFCDYILPAHISPNKVVDFVTSQLETISEFDLRVLSDEHLDGFSYCTISGA